MGNNENNKKRESGGDGGGDGGGAQARPARPSTAGERSAPPTSHPRTLVKCSRADYAASSHGVTLAPLTLNTLSQL